MRILRIRKIRQLSLLTICIIFIHACKKEEIKKEETKENSETYEKGLKDYASYKIGTAITMQFLDADASYKKIAMNEFNSFTCENCMKHDYLSSAQGTYDWSEADYFVNTAVTNNKRIHGHTFIWFRSVPKWIHGFKGNTDQFDSLFKSHIYTLAGRYAGKITAWDVVNEAFKYYGTTLSDTSIWYRKLGKEYIAKAFKYAHEADPNALLFYNETLMEIIPNKIDSVLKMLDGLRIQGLQVDGIGIQMHLHNKFLDTVRIRNIMKKAAEHNYKVHLSELDYAMNSFGDNPVFNDSIKSRQALIYNFVAKAYYEEVPPQLRYGITVWGFTDKHTWVPAEMGYPDWPCLFDTFYNKKPSYEGFKSGLK